MLPGKKYKPEDVLHILRRRFWLFLVPFAVIPATTVVIAWQLPNRYRSEAMIMVVPQGVTDGYVMPAVTKKVEDRLPSITQQILSRTRLEPIVEEFNLYPEGRRDGMTEAVIERMRSDVGIRPARGNAFNVSYVGDDPMIVMRVTERLASSLIAENVISRSALAQGTSQFLEAQLEDARRRLIEHEKKLEAYQRQHSNELPSQVGSNIQVLQNTQLQIQSFAESINRDRERRLMIERQFGEARAEMLTPGPVAVASTDAASQAGLTTAQQLASAQATLHTLEQRFKPGHPEINLWKRRIRDLEAKAAAEPPPGLSSAMSAPRVTSLAERRMKDLQAELELIDRQIASKQTEESRLRQLAATYQRRLEMAPTRESEMVELTRDYETLQTIYTNLLKKQEESKIAANLEERQIGEQLKLVDPARLPERPFTPDRARINLMGIVGGLAIGIGLLALLEYRDVTFRTDEEISSVLSLPVLAVVPVMLSDTDRRRLRLRGIAFTLGLGSTVAVCLGIVVYSFVS